MKNRTMRVAAVLLALTMMTSCFVGGTFAKYTTADTGSDSARVAKWGVVVTGTTGDANQMFAQEYAADDTSYTKGVTVSSSVNVVAPGTKGTFSNFSVTGTPEVAVRVSYVATVTLSNWKADTDNDGSYDDEYCPIIIYVNDVPYYINGQDITTVEGLQNAVNYAIVTKGAEYAPGTNLDQVNDDLNIRWAWAYDGHVGQNDEFDTDLGNYALYENFEPTISISVTCTITQVD